MGDLPAYDAFLLGGPYSVRGFNIGELAACRRFVEGAVELRVPVPFTKQQVGMHGTDVRGVRLRGHMGRGWGWGGGAGCGLHLLRVLAAVVPLLCDCQCLLYFWLRR